MKQHSKLWGSFKGDQIKVVDNLLTIERVKEIFLNDLDFTADLQRCQKLHFISKENSDDFLRKFNDKIVSEEIKVLSLLNLKFPCLELRELN